LLDKTAQRSSEPPIIPQNYSSCNWNKARPRQLYRLDVSTANLQLDSFEELAMPLFDQLYNFAHCLTRNRQEAEDLAQETYVQALKGFGSFQLGTNFRAWMYRILRNTFLNLSHGAESHDDRSYRSRGGRS